MTGWREIKLKDVCEHVTVGFVGSMAEFYENSGIPFLRSLNIHPFRLSFQDLKFIGAEFHHKLRKSALKPGDVAVVRTGYPGTAAVIPKSLGEANCSDLVLIRPSKELNPHFLAAIFNSTFGKNLVSGNLVGAAQQHFNITVAKELRLRMPPKEEQDKIAAILTAYDDLIEVNQRRIAALETMAEELYREWFVRLRFPGHAKVKLVKGRPAKWSEKKFGTFCVLQRGFDLPDADVVPGPYPIIASTSIKGYHHEFKVKPPVVTSCAALLMVMADPPPRLPLLATETTPPPMVSAPVNVLLPSRLRDPALVFVTFPCPLTTPLIVVLLPPVTVSTCAATMPGWMPPYHY
jgi:hypothetical protein